MKLSNSSRQKKRQLRTRLDTKKKKTTFVLTRIVFSEFRLLFLPLFPPLALLFVFLSFLPFLSFFAFFGRFLGLLGLGRLVQHFVHNPAPEVFFSVLAKVTARSVRAPALVSMVVQARQLAAFVGDLDLVGPGFEAVEGEGVPVRCHAGDGDEVFAVVVSVVEGEGGLRARGPAAVLFVFAEIVLAVVAPDLFKGEGLTSVVLRHVRSVLLALAGQLGHFFHVLLLVLSSFLVAFLLKSSS